LGLSLREIAERVGLTASFLSQIERDLASPSIESLRKISDALDVPIFFFLVEPETRNPIVRRDKRLTLTFPDSNFAYELLTPDLTRQMEAFLVEREPGEEKIAIPLRQHTEEFIYVLQGQLEIQLGEEVYSLGPGDSVYFEGPMLRRLAARGDQTLRFISVITPPIF
jgi:transcriptional regulator with XRE-family HTH domain